MLRPFCAAIIPLALASLFAVGCGDDAPKTAPPTSTSGGPTSHSPTAGNLLGNGDFDAGTAHWRVLVGGGTQLRFRAAERRLDVAGRHASRQRGVLDAAADAVPVTRGTAYLLTSTLRVMDPTPKGEARQRVKWLSRDNKLLAVAEGHTAAADKPGTVVLKDRFVAPTGAVRSIVLIGVVITARDRVSFGLSHVSLRATER